MIDFGEHVGEKKSLDLTPMLDVVFLLLIFFMLTSIFAKPMLPLDLPEAASAVAAQEPDVRLVVQQDRSIILNDTAIAHADLQAALMTLFTATLRRDISLVADQQIPFGEIIAIMDMAKLAGAENISVVTEKKP